MRWPRHNWQLLIFSSTFSCSFWLFFKTKLNAVLGKMLQDMAGDPAQSRGQGGLHWERAGMLRKEVVLWRLRHTGLQRLRLAQRDQGTPCPVTSFLPVTSNSGLPRVGMEKPPRRACVQSRWKLRVEHECGGVPLAPNPSETESTAAQGNSRNPAASQRDSSYPPGTWQSKRHVHFQAETFCFFRDGCLYLTCVLFMGEGDRRPSQTNKP